MTEPRYPEHDKVADAQNGYDTLRDFIEQLGEHNVSLATFHESEYMHDPQLVSPNTTESEKIVAIFFDTNPDAIEDERRTTLDSL